MTKRSKAVILTIGSVAVFLVGFVVAEHTFCIIGDGEFQLTVSVRSKGGGTIKIIEAIMLGGTVEEYKNQWSETEETTKYSIDTGSRHATKIDEFNGAPFEINVPFTTHIAFSGRELYYGHSRVLYVIVTYVDGKRILRVFKIPDRKVSTSMTIELP